MTQEFPTSLPDFMRIFPDEQHCLGYLEKTRWPDGFVCPKCGSIALPYRIATRPRVLTCRECKEETSITAGTVMHRSHTPVCTWFWGAYLISSHTPGVSAVQFQRQLGLGRYETAFQMLHKLRAGMVRPDRDRIGGVGNYVEVDETFVGGKTRGEGRGVHHKTIVAGAVEVREGQAERRHTEAIPKRGKTYAGRLRLQVVRNRRSEALEEFVTGNIEPGGIVVTDGWEGYSNLDFMGYQHAPVVVGGDPEQNELWLRMIHIVFSNLKTWLLGIHHGVSPQHLQAYLNEFTFRFNRRFYPFNAFNSLLGIGIQVESPTYEDLYSGDWVHPVPGLESSVLTG